MAEDRAVLSEVEVTLDEVDEALGRLAEGTYGTCTVCGCPIDESRLSDIPTAATCAAHPV